MTKYTTSQGDTWDMIAFSVYGSHGYTSMLIEANPDYINIVIFGAGIVLTVPEISTAQQISALAPPWKR